ncbi:MAG: hypothetical protein AAFR16_10800 [Pseudomonadota bacterium]
MITYFKIYLAVTWRFLKNFATWLATPWRMVRGLDPNSDDFYFKTLNFFLVCLVIEFALGRAAEGAGIQQNTFSGVVAEAFKSIGIEHLSDYPAYQALAQSDFVIENIAIILVLLFFSLLGFLTYLAIKTVARRFRVRHALIAILPLQGVALVLNAMATLAAGEAAAATDLGLAVSPTALWPAYIAFAAFSWATIAQFLILRVGFGVPYWMQIGAMIFAGATLLIGPVLVFAGRAAARLWRRNASSDQAQAAADQAQAAA